MKDNFFRHGPDSGPQQMNERVVAQMLVGRVGESVILVLNTSFRLLNNPLPDSFRFQYVKNALVFILNF